MTRHRRPAYSLLQVIVMLPLLAVITSTSWMLISRTIRVQGSECRRANTEAVMRDLVRRIQTDARQATGASASSDKASDTLTLNLPEGQIVYRDLQGKITRTCTSQPASPVVFDWPFATGSVQFRLENIADTRQIAWITILHHVQQQAGSTRTWHESAAAPVGQGGMR